MKILIETDRLLLRHFDLSDADFVLRLVNSTGWLAFIGDRNVHTLDDASAYLLNGPLKSYQENGFGLSLVALKNERTPIGMCGLVKRASLEHADIGFAFLPEFTGQGYAFEIAKATMAYAINELQLDSVLAITLPTNTASIRLLGKIGLHFEKLIGMGEESLMLFSTLEKR